MKNRILAGLTLAGVAILASCGQDLTQSTAVPTAASFAKVVTPGCSYSTAAGDARSYFSSNKDTVLTLLTAMSKTSGAAATSAGWGVLAQLAAEVGTTAVKGTPAQGSTFANDVLLCMSVPTYTNSAGSQRRARRERPVRGAQWLERDALAVVSRGTPAVWRRAQHEKRGRWPGTTLFYGSPVTSPLFDNETPAGVVFDLKSLPGGLTFTPMIRVGVCTSLTRMPESCIDHSTGSNPVILSPDLSLSFCTTTASATRSSSALFAAAASLATWLAPEPAHAATTMFKLGGGGTGLVGGLSDIGPVSFTSVVTFTVKPKNSSVSKNRQFVPTVTVQNLTAKGHAIAGVQITLSVTTNNGSFNITGNTATTDANGIATFPNLHIDKAGGYTMTATSEVAARPASSSTSTDSNRPSMQRLAARRHSRFRAASASCTWAASADGP